MSVIFSNKRKIIVALILVLVLSVTVLVACKNTHECQDVCDTCGLCKTDCDDENCKGKCECKVTPPEPHFCKHACEICGGCKDATCKDKQCQNKCAGNHDPELYVTVGKVRVGLISDTIVRVELQGAKGFENRNTYLVSNRNAGTTPKHTEQTVNGATVITTESYKVYVPQNATGLNGVRITDTADNLLWEYNGETTSNVYLPSPGDELSSWYFSDSPRIVPGELGYSYVKDADPLQGWDFDNDAPDCYVFLPQGDYKQFCNDYVSLTGSSEMVSLQMLGYWDSRWYAYSSETAIEQIKEYTDRGYSIDVLVIDKDWHSDNGVDGVGYQVNTELFPDMAGFLDECHEMGVNIMFNDHPEPVNGTGNILDGEEVQYRNQKLTMILALGLDYWWYDRNWHVSLKEVAPDVSVYAFGMYAYQFVTDEYLQSITDLDEYADRALIMGNVDGCLHGKWTYASDISAHRYSIQWTGDINTDTTALAQEIYATIFGGAEVGLPYVSSDLGGHTAPVTDDMYVRWLQYGALSTICRVHCTNVEQIGQEGRMPWLFGDDAEAVVHEYVDMRYRLLPLFYSLARENFDSGLPIMRRTDIEYPQYNEASRNDQYMLGENVLVAPFDSAEKLTAVPREWLTVKEGNGSGLNASYYNAANSFENPVKTAVDANVFFNWENGGPDGLGADNFSVRWEGNIKINGEKDARLCFFADDGVRAWIDGVLVVDSAADGKNKYDTMLYTPYYKSGSSHTIKVEYYEEYGGAHCYMYYGERESDGGMTPNSREVFIPDGVWIDVWSGERYVGPQTITVSHGLTTSPIFVREGGILVLAENMKNTSEKDWSNMSLDVYAGKTSTSTVLYEDDTKTQAYKYGQYRKTLITNEFANNKFTVTVNPAEGSFTGKLAFDERNWTVRIHAQSEWGAIKSVQINGKNFRDFAHYNKTDDACPFAFSGASLDSDIYEFTIDKAKVTDKIVITFAFENEITAAQAPEYDDNPSSVAVDVQQLVGDEINLTDAGEIDWAYFGVENVGAIARKKTEDRYIGELNTYSGCSLYSGTLYARWSDGDDDFATGKAVHSGLVSQKDFSVTFKVDKTERFYVLNLGGEQCIAKLTVRDRAGNARTFNFGNLNGSFSRRVVISASSDAETEIEARYSVLVSKTDGTGSPSKVNVGAMYVTGEVKDVVIVDASSITAKVSDLKEAPNQVNLSATDASGMMVADWRHFGRTTVAYTSKKQEQGKESVIAQTSFTGDNNGQSFDDYKTSISWTDGDETAVNNGSTDGTCVKGDIDLSFNVRAGKTKIILYTGVWNGTNSTRVYNSKGQQIGTAQSFSAGNPSSPKVIEVDIESEIETTILINIHFSNGSGNVSLAAIQVLEEAE